MQALSKNVVQENDGWTIRTKDRKISCHFEHTIAVTKEKADILSSFEPIEAAVKRNKNLYQETETVS